MSQIDWVALLRRLTWRNVAVGVTVFAYAAFVVIAVAWFASYAWGAS